LSIRRLLVGLPYGQADAVGSPDNESI